jgi:hypothetical protein
MILDIRGREIAKYMKSRSLSLAERERTVKQRVGDVTERREAVRKNEKIFRPDQRL